MLNKSSISLIGQRNMAVGAYEFYLTETRPDGTRWIGTNLMMVQTTLGLQAPGPTFSIPMSDSHTLQQLADELGAMGFVPRASQAQQGELTAVRYHLEDMRKLAKVK